MAWISDEYRKLDQSPRSLRSFGLLVGSVFLLIGGVLLWRHRGIGWLFLAIGFFLVVGGGVAPSMLRPVHGAWMILALAMGWVMTRILLTLVFYFVVTPVGFLQRIFGKRTIEVAFGTDLSSYWEGRTTRPQPKEYERQF